MPDWGGRYSLIRKNRRHSILVSSSQELGAKTTLSGDVLYSDRQFSAANTGGSAPNLLPQSTFASGSARQLNATAGLDVARSSDWPVPATRNYSRRRQTRAART